MNKLIRESISFERNKDPKQTMGISKLKKIKEELYKHRDVNSDLSDADQLLEISAELRNFKYVKYLIEVHNAHPKNAIFPVLVNGDLNIFKYLHKKIGNLNNCEITLNNMLCLAITNYHNYKNLDIIKYLVESNPNILHINDARLYIAAREDHLDIVKYLVEHGATTTDAVITAARNNINIVNYLISKINEVD